jgi:type IV secretion system protein VirD4
MRGMGIRLWLFFQSLDQLNKCFGDNAGTVLDNLATQQYFSTNSYETAEAISKRIGDETIVIRTEGDNRGISTNMGGDGKNPGSRNSGSNTSYSEAVRRVLKPEEILVLPENTALIFHKNNYVIVCDKIKYYADRAFRRRGIVFFRRWGTGRSRKFGPAEMVMGLAVLALSLVVTRIVASLPTPVQQWPGAFAPGRVFNDSHAGVGGDGFGGTDTTAWPLEPWQEPPVFQPAPHSPFLRRQGRRPLP